MYILTLTQTIGVSDVLCTMDNGSEIRRSWRKSRFQAKPMTRILACTTALCLNKIMTIRRFYKITLTVELMFDFHLQCTEGRKDFLLQATD